MSIFNIAPYFPFRRIKIVKQTVLPNASEARIQAEPDKRFQPICYFCGQKAATVHSWTQRTVRDKHGHHPGLDCLSLSQAVLSSLPQYQYRRFRVISSLSASDYPGLDWKTVKNIDKMHLEGRYGQPDYEGLRILAVDEIATRKGHRYLTVALDYLSGRVVYVGKDRKAKTLKRFFNQLTAKQRKSIEAVIMDMWKPFIKAVKKNYRMP
jgi:hypothetical protein